MRCILLMGLLALTFDIAVAGDSIACNTSPRWQAWLEKCKLASEQLRNSPIPVKLRNAECSEAYYQSKGESSRCQYYRMGYEQLHIVLAEAFYSKRKDHRQQSMGTLFFYRCEDTTRCNEFKHLLDSHIKANVLAWRRYHPRLIKQAEKIRSQL